MSPTILFLTITATVATSSTATVTEVPPPPPLPAPPAMQSKPSPAVAPLPDLTLQLGAFQARLMAQYWARFIGDSGRDLREGPFLEYVGQRARLGAHVTHESGIAARVLLQDVRTWGEETNTLNNFSAAGFDVQEAFVELPLLDLARLRFGRQELVVDNARLIGNVIWTLRARSFDGARVDATFGDLKTMLFYAKVQERDQNPDGTVPPNVGADRDLAIAYASYDFMKKHKLTVAYILDLASDSSRQQHTFGPTLNGKVAAFDYGLEAFLQVGERGGDDPLRFLLAGRAGYTLDVPTKPRFFVFTDVVSSNGTAAGTFDTLFATNHKFYGEMDFFLNLPLHTGGRGLLNPGAGVTLVPVERIRLIATWHHFAAYDKPSPLGRHFGDEVDLKAVIRLFPHVQLRALYGFLIPQEAFIGRFGVGANRTEHFVYATLAADL